MQIMSMAMTIKSINVIAIAFAFDMNWRSCVASDMEKSSAVLLVGL